MKPRTDHHHAGAGTQIGAQQAGIGERAQVPDPLTRYVRKLPGPPAGSHQQRVRAERGSVSPLDRALFAVNGLDWRAQPHLDVVAGTPLVGQQPQIPDCHLPGEITLEQWGTPVWQLTLSADHQHRAVESVGSHARLAAAAA